MMLLGSRRPGAAMAAQALAMAVLLLAVLAILGYTYDLVALYGIATFVPMALHAATSFLVLSGGVLFARPREGLMAFVTADTAAGFMARLLLPTVILVPIVVGWLPLAGGSTGLEVAAALFVALNLAILLMFTWLIASRRPPG